MKKLKRRTLLCSNPPCWNLVERTESQLGPKGIAFCSAQCRDEWLIKENPNSSPEGRKRRSEYMRGDLNPMKNPEVSAKFKGGLNPAKRPEVRKKISKNNPMHDPAIRAKVTGIPKPPGFKEIISSRVTEWIETHPGCRKGINNGMYGKNHTESAKEAVSIANKGKKCGPDNPSWNGGKSFEPYCAKFNEEFKERCRAFFNYECVICGKPQKENDRKLSCHHVNYDKQICCNDNPAYFAVLCTSCHGKTGHRRELWMYILKYIIDEIYNGKSYYTREEWNALRKDQCEQ